MSINVLKNSVSASPFVGFDGMTKPEAPRSRLAIMTRLCCYIPCSLTACSNSRFCFASGSPAWAACVRKVSASA